MSTTTAAHISEAVTVAPSGAAVASFVAALVASHGVNATQATTMATTIVVTTYGHVSPPAMRWMRAGADNSANSDATARLRTRRVIDESRMRRRRELPERSRAVRETHRTAAGRRRTRRTRAE